MIINHKGTQAILTQRTTLRKIGPEDLETISIWMHDPEVTKYEDWIPHESVDYTRGFISYLTEDYKSEQIYCWGIYLDNSIIGFVKVSDVNEWNGSIGYWLSKDYWLKGYATEATAAVIDYMFSEVGINRIDAKHSVKNTASGKVLKKLGMAFRGRVKDYEYYTSKSEWHSCDFYAITREQYLHSA